MVTKGIIKSIDYNGNTCKVRVPILESACDDAEIVLSAIFATAPGIFNGYKEEDVVIVSFEDNNYENAIILGKLYLGASKENEDPRGTVSCANLKSENQATIPLSSKLVYDAKDKNTANVKGSYNDYKTLADIVDGLQTQKTEIGSLNVKVIDDGENLGAEIAKKISITDETTKQRGLGWNLNTENWKINAKDTVTNENGETEVKNINIVTIDRNGMSIAGDLKLNGYPKNIIVRYAQNGSDKDYPYLYKFKQDSFPDTEIDKTWYYNKYIKITEADKEKYILISSENIDDYTITPSETVAYVYNLEEINTEWKTETPARVDGKYIWQWTHTEAYLFDKNNDAWIEKDDDRIVCITGATGSTGEPATIYWASFSTPVHTGKNQASNIEIIPYAKTGNAPEVIDTTAYFKYSLNNGTTWNNDDWVPVTTLQDNKIIILAKDIIADNIIVKLAHAHTDQEDSTSTVYSEYETETITYSPLNTPVLDLNNDSAALNYTTDGTKINANDKVSSTATLYLNGEAITTACYIWYLENCTTDIAFVSNNKHLITNTISINGLKANAGTATCLAFKDKDIKAVVVRSVWSEADWTNFSTGEQIWSGSDALEENEYFVVIGRATDSKKFHVILGQAIGNINGEIHGKTVSYDEAFTKVFSITKQLKGDTGNTGIAINNTKQWYILWPANDSNRPKPAPIQNNTEPENPSTTSTLEKWMSTPPEAVNDHNVWTCYGSIFSDDPGSGLINRHITYSTPVKDAAYALAQGKTTNYYSPTEPVNKIKIGDCWFDTGYVKLTTNPDTKAGYLGKFVVCQASTEGSVRVKALGADRYIPSNDGSTYLVKITPYNIDDNKINIEVGTTAAYETGNLKQCSSLDANGKATWTDIAGELVTNKLTANYINALDITTKKITVLQDNNDEQSQILFKADGTSKDGTVKIGGFDVKNNTLTATDDISANLVQLMPDKILMQATKSAYWFKNTRTIEDAHSTYSYAYLFKYLETAANSGTWEDFSKKYSSDIYDYEISSVESPENSLVMVPYVKIHNKTDKNTAIFTFYYSYLNSVTQYKYNENKYEIWIEDTSKKRLLIPYGTTVINDGTYEYPINTFITEINSTAWAKLDNNSTDYSKYSNYIYDNYTTYYDNYESSSSFNNGEYNYLKLKITKDIPTTFNIYLGISSNFNIAQNFDTVIALEPTDKDTPKFEFTKDDSYSFIESTDFILKASTSGNYVSGNLEDLIKVTYPSIVASEENPKYIYIIYVNRNNTKNVTAIGSGTSTTVVDTAGFCVIPKFITYSDSKLSIGPNFKVTPSGQLTAKNAVFEDNITLIGGGKLGAFELNNNKLSNSAMILDSTGVSLKDYKYLSIGNTKQFRLFKSQIDKSYVDIGGSSTDAKNMVDVSYMQSYHPIIIQKLTPSTNSASSQSTTSTLQGASILLTSNENVVTQYFHITPTVSSITPVVSKTGITLVGSDKFDNNRIHTVHGTENSIITGTRYVIDFKVEVFEKDDKGNEKSETAKKDYNFTFDAVFSTAISATGSVIKSCSIRVPKGRSTASTSYSWTIRGASSYEFKGIKSTGGSTTKEKLILTETFTNSDVPNSAIQLSSTSIYLNSNTYVNGDILTASDRNLKENINYLDYYADYSNIFNYLKPAEFNYKNSNLTQFGFIAQDILESLPLLDKDKKYSLVVKNNDYYAVDYNSIIALNTLQIKYLTNKLSQLETAYNELLKKIEDK